MTDRWGNDNQKFKAWYIPQIPMKAFEVVVDTATEAQAALDLLINFSIFEYDNKVKPDYCDSGGIVVWDEADQDWTDYEHDRDAPASSELPFVYLRREMLEAFKAGVKAELVYGVHGTGDRAIEKAFEHWMQELVPPGDGED